MSLKLNSMDPSIFLAKGTDNSTIRTNSGEIKRRDIIATGRLLTCEAVGRKINSKVDVKEKYRTRLDSSVSYDDLSKVHKESKLLFCAAVANKAVGKEAPASIEEVYGNPAYCKDANFLRTMAEIDKDVIQPLFFSVLDDMSVNGLMKWESVPMGATKEIDVKSNAVMLFEDSSWGSSRSASYQYLYGRTITLNPTPKTTQCKIKWYQDIVNGEAGEYYAAIMRGIDSKIYALFTEAMLTAAANTKYVPTALSNATYTSANWTTITTKVAAANGLQRRNLIAFGSAAALAQVLPVDGTGGAITGLQYGLGEEWTRNTFLPNVGGVDLVEIQPAIVPGTENSSVTTIFPETVIFIAAKGGDGYAPLYGAYAEGSPITLTLTPRETADLTIDMNVTAVFGIAPVFASKIGYIGTLS